MQKFTPIGSSVDFPDLFSALLRVSKSVAGAILWTHLLKKRLPRAAFKAAPKALKVWQAWPK